jgi:hypothetical protein
VTTSAHFAASVSDISRARGWRAGRAFLLATRRPYSAVGDPGRE